MIKGVIFDFNGTLYLDHDLNQQSWQEAFNSIKPTNIDANYNDLDKHNTPNDYSLSKAIYNYFNIDASKEEIDRLSDNKEKRYRQLAIEKNRNELIKGLDGFLSFLKEKNIPFCIASMAPRSNFDFYFEYLKLNRWFSYDNIIYDNGNYNDKNSQIIDAARILKLDVKDCLIIEDTPTNIQMARDILKANKFIYINSKNIKYNIEEILQEIKDYTEIDYHIFNN